MGEENQYTVGQVVNGFVWTGNEWIMLKAGEAAPSNAPDTPPAEVAPGPRRGRVPIIVALVVVFLVGSGAYLLYAKQDTERNCSNARVSFSTFTARNDLTESDMQAIQARYRKDVGQFPFKCNPSMDSFVARWYPGGPAVSP